MKLDDIFNPHGGISETPHVSEANKRLNSQKRNFSNRRPAHYANPKEQKGLEVFKITEIACSRIFLPVRLMYAGFRHKSRAPRRYSIRGIAFLRGRIRRKKRLFTSITRVLIKLQKEQMRDVFILCLYKPFCKMKKPATNSILR